MNKTKSFVYGFAVGFLGLIVAVLLYFLYFKGKKVNGTYYWVGVFAIAIVLSVVLGMSILAGFLSQYLGGLP